MSASPTPLLAVVGPTASGKTALAIERALASDGEIISVDSRQIYRGFAIGTAQPTTEERALVPHHLVGALDPTETINAGRYVELIRESITDIMSRGKRPILCGGTGLYLRVLRMGLGNIERVDPKIRAKIEATIAAEGKQAAWKRLAAIDAAYAATIHPNNVQRLTRAFEILETTGRPPTEGRKWEADDAVTNAFEIEGVGVGSFLMEMIGTQYSRADLYARINRRTTDMLTAGWVDEVRSLLDAGVPRDAHPMQGVGYREIAEALDTGTEIELVIPAIQQRTRNFAKRQVTWFRKEPVEWIEGAAAA